MHPKFRRQLRQGVFFPESAAIATRALNAALCCFLFIPTSHTPLDRSAFSLSRCPKIRSRRKTSSRLPIFSLFLPGSCPNNRDRRSSEERFHDEANDFKR